MLATKIIVKDKLHYENAVQMTVSIDSCISYCITVIYLPRKDGRLSWRWWWLYT